MIILSQAFYQNKNKQLQSPTIFYYQCLLINLDTLNKFTPTIGLNCLINYVKVHQ